MMMEDNEVEEIKIKKTKLSKEKKILYIETEQETVADLFRRGSMAKNRDYQLVNYIPPQLFQRYRKAQDICALLRQKHAEVQFTVRIEQKDISIKTRENKDKYWKDITDDFTHELDDWEMDREWDGLENTVDRKQYVEFTPGKGKRESESMLDRENLKRKEGITPPKGTTPKKNKE